MTDKRAPKAAGAPAKQTAKSPAVPQLPAELRWLPQHPVTAKPIDGRTVDARAIRGRMEDYWRAVTNGGRRALAPQEVPLIRSIVGLEFALSNVLAEQAGGRSSPEDLSRTTSELRRCVAELGLRAPGALPDATPGDAPDAAVADPDTDLSRLSDEELETMYHLVAKVAGQQIDAGSITLHRPGLKSGAVIDIASLTDDEKQALADVIARIEAEAAAKVVPDYDATVTALRIELSILRERVANQDRLAALATAQVSAIECDALPLTPIRPAP